MAEVRDRIGIGHRILRAAGITIPHAGRISFRATSLASLLLASCCGGTGSYTVQSVVLTPGNDDCRATDYEGMVKTRLRSLRAQDPVGELSKNCREDLADEIQAGRDVPGEIHHRQSEREEEPDVYRQPLFTPILLSPQSGILNDTGL